MTTETFNGMYRPKGVKEAVQFNSDLRRLIQSERKRERDAILKALRDDGFDDVDEMAEVIRQKVR